MRVRLIDRIGKTLNTPVSFGQRPETEGPGISAKSVEFPKNRNRQRLFGSGQDNLFSGPGEYPDWADWSGDGYSDTPAAVFISVLMNVITWIVAIGSQADLRIIDKETKEEADVGKPLIELVSMPAGDPTLFTYLTLMCTLLYGNAYWHIPRDRYGVPTDMKYAPPWSTRPGRIGEPVTSGIRETRATHWQIGGDTYLPDEILHLRNGIDPYEPRLGLPPPRQILTEVLLDAQASGYTSEILENLGYAANILIPETPISPKDTDKMAEKFAKKFGPGRRGATFIPNIPLQHHFLKADVFKGADLKDIKNISEERASSAYRIQPAVVGFGTGMEQVKVGATMVASTRTSWRAGVVPPLDFIRRQIRTQLFPMFAIDPTKYDAIYDPSAISALQEDPLERRRGLSLGLNKQAWLTQNEARRIDGMDPIKDVKYDKIAEPPPKIAKPPAAGGAAKP